MTYIRSDSTQVSSWKEVSLLTGLWWWWWLPPRAKIITRLLSPAAAAAGGGAIGGAVGGGALATEPCAAGEYNKYKQIQQKIKEEKHFQQSHVLLKANKYWDFHFEGLQANIDQITNI